MHIVFTVDPRKHGVKDGKLEDDSEKELLCFLEDVQPTPAIGRAVNLETTDNLDAPPTTGEAHSYSSLCGIVHSYCT